MVYPCLSHFPYLTGDNTVFPIANGLLLLVDAVIFGMTVYHTYSIIKLRHQLPELGGTSLPLLMFQQGRTIISMPKYVSQVTLIY